MNAPDSEPNPQTPLPVSAARSIALHLNGAYPRAAVLLSSLVLLLVLLAFTAFISRMYHKKVHSLADDWFAQGESDFQKGDAAQAVVDYRNALVYSPGNSVFQLHLAQSLMLAGRVKEAQSYLLNLLTESPGDGEINLDLARAEKDSMPDALRYYHGAVYGVWQRDPVVMRWNVRREMCEYLLARSTVAQAQPEIIALAQDVPPGNIDSQKVAAALLLRGKLWTRALDAYRAILAVHNHDEDALAGAGIAAFEMGQYARARSYFDELSPQRASAPDVSPLLAEAQDVEAENPFVRELSSDERARRTLAAIARAESRLSQCSQQFGQPIAASPPVTQLQKLYAEMEAAKGKWNQPVLARDPSTVDAAMQWVFQAEKAAARQCGEPQDTADRALLSLSRSRVLSNERNRLRSTRHGTAGSHPTHSGYRYSARPRRLCTRILCALAVRDRRGSSLSHARCAHRHLFGHGGCLLPHCDPTYQLLVSRLFARAPGSAGAPCADARRPRRRGAGPARLSASPRQRREPDQGRRVCAERLHPV
jgi:tetratricopeptide (TPR) repeat protein